jgi:hypothetical protein
VYITHVRSSRKRIGSDLDNDDSDDADDDDDLMDEEKCIKVIIHIIFYKVLIKNRKRIS